MMDSQEKALNQGQNEVIKEEVSAQTIEAPAAESTSQVETKEEQPQKVYASKAEILERVREIAHGDETPQKEEVDYLKTAFYKLHIAEREAHIKAFIDGGGDPEQYQILPDSVEEAFKAEMGIIKEKRAKLFKEQEAEKQENLTKKLAIIDKIKSMITTQELSGVQKPTTAVARDQKRTCRKGQRALAQLSAVCRAVLRHAPPEQHRPRRRLQEESRGQNPTL